MSKCIVCGKECKGECCCGACRAKKSRRTRTAAHAIEHVAAHGGEVSFKTVKGRVQDVHITPSELMQGKVTGELTKARQTNDKGFNE